MACWDLSGRSSVSDRMWWMTRLKHDEPVWTKLRLTHMSHSGAMIQRVAGSTRAWRCAGC